MRKAVAAVVLVAAAGAGYWFYQRTRTPQPPTVTTAVVTRGDIVEAVGATGTLQAVTTVQVGTQVSGTIQSLNADFNSIVKKGQVIARLDPSLFQTQIEQARANLIRAQADLERLRVALADAQTKLGRARELSLRQLIPRTDLETAEVNVRSAEAQIRSAEAQVTQAQASLNQNQVNLAHTVIAAPIDGLVISRNVDVGQTVAASMQAPTLFVLAADLTKMQVVANLDESDVGRIRPNQAVTFRVDAYPADAFRGIVSQVRLEPKVQQNVVTYATVIDVPNDDLKLKPGMTANVSVEIARATNVLRIPNGALRFRPTAEIFAALGQTPPDPSGRGGVSGTSRGGGSGGSTEQGTSGTGDAAPGGGRGLPADPDARRAVLAERLQNLPPDRRDAMIERLRSRGIDPTAAVVPGTDAATPRARQGRGRGSAQTPTDQPPGALVATGAATIDALFAPLPRTETVGRAWRYENGQLHAARLRLGISDGQNTELIEGDVTDGTEVVTSVTIAGQSTRPAASTFPFGQPGRGAFGGNGGNRAGGGRTTPR